MCVCVCASTVHVVRQHTQVTVPQLAVIKNAFTKKFQKVPFQEANKYVELNWQCEVPMQPGNAHQSQPAMTMLGGLIVRMDLKWRTQALLYRPYRVMFAATMCTHYTIWEVAECETWIQARLELEVLTIEDSEAENASASRDVSLKNNMQAGNKVVH